MGELAFANFRMTRTMGTSNVYRVLKSVLASIGAIALLTVAAAALLTYEQQQTNDDRRNEATPEDVAFVLNQAGLNPGGNFQILNSYESARPLIINDHIDGYCIKLGHQKLNAHWTRITDIDKPFLDAIVFGTNSARNELPCMPSETQLASGHFLVHSMAFRFIAIDQIDGGEFSLFDPSTNSLFYVSFQM